MHTHQITNRSSNDIHVQVEIIIEVFRRKLHFIVLCPRVLGFKFLTTGIAMACKLTAHYPWCCREDANWKLTVGKLAM